MVVRLDQTQEDRVKASFGRTQQELGAPFLQRNEAGEGSTGKQVAEVDPHEWGPKIRVNLLRPFYCCQHSIRASSSG